MKLGIEEWAVQPMLNRPTVNENEGESNVKARYGRTVQVHPLPVLPS